MRRRSSIRTEQIEKSVLVFQSAGAREDRCVIQIDLFSARGIFPKTLADVAQREKDIQFPSRTRLNTDTFKELQTLRRTARRLYTKLPDDLKNDPDAVLLNAAGYNASVTTVHLIHPPWAYETQSKDYEFSRLSVEEHWQAGQADVRRTLQHPDWITRGKLKDGVTIFDLKRDGLSD